MVGEGIFPLLSVPPFPDEEDEEDPEEDAPRPDIDLPPGVDPRDEPDPMMRKKTRNTIKESQREIPPFPRKKRNSGLHSPLFTSGRE